LVKVSQSSVRAGWSVAKVSSMALPACGKSAAKDVFRKEGMGGRG
jgi:hypothetical protein